MTRKLEAVQAAVKSYFERFPRVSIKALSMRTGVPYATLRRILQNEVNDIKDETIFKLIDRVMLRQERMVFIKDHYPALAKVIVDYPEHSLDDESAIDLLKRFRYLDPHNYIIKLALTTSGTSRDDVQRLTGERGIMALEEMLDAGLMVEERDVIRIEGSGHRLLDLDDMLHQIGKDLQYFPRSMVGTQYARLGHMSESVTKEALLKMVEMSGELMKNIEKVKDSEIGDVPFFFDIVISTYDRHALIGKKDK
ncbi:MAG: hypothetical protein ACOVS5_04640 [Oligoflexus sp.]|jgi:hypothetical protein